MLDHTLWCGSLPASLSLSHSPSVCRYLSPAVRLRRRCPPPGTCGGETWKEHGRGGGAGTAHWAGCKAVRVLITIYGPECDDFRRKAERNAALGSTNDWDATISNVERRFRDLERRRTPVGAVAANGPAAWLLLQTDNGLQLQLQGTGSGKRLLCLMAIARRNAVATERNGAMLQRSAVAADAIWLQWRPRGQACDARDCDELRSNNPCG